MDMNFCRRCSAPLDHVTKHVYKCQKGHTLFANASPSVGIFFLAADNMVLLSERGIEPRKGMLDAFGGFLESGETLEAAVVRELQEELGLQPHEYEPPKYLTSGTGAYTYQGEEIPVLSALYWSRLTTDRQLEPTDDVANSRIFPLHSIDMDRLHDKDIRAGILELQRLFPDTGNTLVH